jgi:hypothetical protein
MKTNKLILVASALALSISLLGCNKGPDSAVLARVNQAKITAADFKHQL